MMVAVLSLILIFLVMTICFSIRSNNDRKDMIQSLLRQTSRWAVASQQDKSPMIAVLHANYAVAYLDALQSIAKPEELADLVEFDLFKNKIIHIQDYAVRNAVKVCPQYLGKELDRMLAKRSISAPVDPKKKKIINHGKEETKTCLNNNSNNNKREANNSF